MFPPAASHSHPLLPSAPPPEKSRSSAISSLSCSCRRSRRWSRHSARRQCSRRLRRILTPSSHLHHHRKNRDLQPSLHCPVPVAGRDVGVVIAPADNVPAGCVAFSPPPPICTTTGKIAIFSHLFIVLFLSPVATLESS